MSTTALIALLLAAPAFAAKDIVNYFGTAIGSGSFGGEFNNPRDPVVNRTGAGPANPGDIYVVDQANNRVQRFDANGKFVSAWGANVTRRDEVQVVKVIASGGTYTLTVNGDTTAPITYNTSAANVDNALDALPSVGGDANVSVTGSFFNASGYIVTFTGALAGTDIPLMTADGEALTGNPRSVTVGTSQNGSGGPGTDYEICTIAAECGAAFASAGNGTTAGNGGLSDPQSVTVDNDTGNVYVSDRLNFRINEYDGVGNFIASFGWDVDADELGTEYEVCPASNACKAGIAGSGAGQVGNITGFSAGTLGLAVSPPDENAASGTLFLADSQNRRVSTYALDGTSPSSFGTAAEFSEIQPKKVAVDSRGIVYATNTLGGGRIERYDSENANGGGAVFLSPILAPGREEQIIHFEGFEHTFPRNTYRLTCPNGELTDPIFYLEEGGEQGAFNVQSALDAKCGANSFSTPGGAANNPPNTKLVYEGIFEGVDVPPIECFGIEPPTGTCSVTTLVDGFPGPLLPNTNFSAFSTPGLAVDPDTDGGGPDEDVLYVLRRPTVGNNVVQQFGPDNDPGATAAPTATDDAHGTSAGLTFGQGIGLNDSNGRLYVPSNQSVPSLGAGSRVYVFDDASAVPDPGLTIDPVTVKGETTATFSGTVDPMGALVSCDFQYSTDQSSWVDVDADGARSTGNLNGTNTVTNAFGGGFQVGQTITSSDGGIPPNTTITAVNGGTLTLSQAATTSGQGVVLTVTGCANLNPNGGPQAIKLDTTGLDPAQQYYVRLKASRPLVANSDTYSANVQPFATDAVPPVLSKIGAIDVRDTSARLVVTIDPRNSSTGYVFQYGTTPALGSSTAPLNIGGGTTPKTLSQVIGGLTPDTTYYFRVVATNLTSTTTSSSHTFHTRATAPEDPEGRGIEMVSPIDKNYADVDKAIFPGQVTAAIDGNGVGICTTAIFGEPAGNMEIQCAPYILKRTGNGSTGWETFNPIPPHCHFTPEAAEGTVYTLLSATFARVATLKSETEDCPVPPLDPNAPFGPPGQWAWNNLYIQDRTTDPETFSLLNPEFGAVGELGGGGAVMNVGSDDFGHVVYVSNLNQTEPPDSPAPGTFRKLYEWTAQGEGSCVQPGGCLALMSRNTANEPFTTSSGMPTGRYGGMLTSSVSDDGSRMYFQNPVPNSNSGLPGNSCSNAGCELYVRENGAGTHFVSETECTLGVTCGTDASRADRFITATPSGDHAFFASCAKLTNESSPQGGCTNPIEGTGFGGMNGSSGSKLYRWDRNAPPTNQLIDLTVDNEAGDGVQPTFRGVTGISDDGNVAYFVTSGQIISGEPTNVGEKMYRWSYNGGNPTREYLGVVAGDLNFAQLRDVVDPAGKYVVIYTSLAIDEAADSDSDIDVYRWDEENDWICVSCQLPGVPSAGDANARVFELEPFFEVPLANTLGSYEPKSYIGPNGDVFFGTPDALVPADVNGEGGCPLNTVLSFGGDDIYSCEDVYQWHDGKLHLLSSGTGANGAVFISTTPSGKDAFFYTDQRLVGWDLDNNVDIYDSRVGGGFPEPPPQPPTCEGEACRDVGSVPLNVSGAGTKVFEGPGNQSKAVNRKVRCRRGFVKRRGKCVKRRQVRKRASKRRRAARKSRGARR